MAGGAKIILTERGGFVRFLSNIPEHHGKTTGGIDKMIKRIVTGLSLVLAMGYAVPAMAAFKVDVEQVINQFGDSRIEGQGRHYGLAFDINEDTDLGFYYERGQYQWTGDVGSATPNTTQLNADLQAIRVNRKITNLFAVGIDIGNAKIQQGAQTIGSIGALNQNKPFAGINATVRYGKELKENVSTDMHLSLGYRFLDLNDVSTGITNESTIDDLNALTLALGIGFKF
jgi:hypothetical protein